MSSALAGRDHSARRLSASSQYLQQYPPHDSQNFTFYSTCRPHSQKGGSHCDVVPLAGKLPTPLHFSRIPTAAESSQMAASSADHAAGIRGNYLRRKTPFGILEAGYDGESYDFCAQAPASKRPALQPLASSVPDTDAMANLDLSPKDPLRQAACTIFPSALPFSWDGLAYTVGRENMQDGSLSGTTHWSWIPNSDIMPQTASTQWAHSSMSSMADPVSPSAVIHRISLARPSIDAWRVPQSTPRKFRHFQDHPSIFTLPSFNVPSERSEHWVSPSVDSAAGTRFFASAEAQLLQDGTVRGNRNPQEQDYHPQSSHNTALTASLGAKLGGSPITVRRHSVDAVKRVSGLGDASYPFSSAVSIDVSQLSDPATILKWGRSICNLLMSTNELTKQRKSRRGHAFQRHDSINISSNIRVTHDIHPKLFHQPEEAAGSRHFHSQLHKQGSIYSLQQTGTSQREAFHGLRTESNLLLTSDSGSTDPHRVVEVQSSPLKWMSFAEQLGDFTNCAEQDLVVAAKAALDALAKHCRGTNSTWIDGMALAGSLCQALSDYHGCAHWCSRVLQLDGSHVEAMSSLAAAMLCLDRRQDAERYWRAALNIRPGFLEAAEQLVGLLCTDGRREEALELIEYVCETVQFPGSRKIPASTRSRRNASRSASDSCSIYPSSVDGIEQFVRLLYAKGNLLYSSQDHHGAATAFEHVVLIAIQDCLTLAELISLILRETSRVPEGHAYIQRHRRLNDPVLLTPERARDTAKLCFAPNGDLPGLRSIQSHTSRTAVRSIVSNSLLSLAKIFQDTVASAAVTCSNARVPYQVGDILALYYLSFSLQPSPSTANNVGILLASFQQMAVPPPQGFPNMVLPGVTPGSGVWLAFLYYQYGLELDPRHAHLYTNLGSLLKDLGHLPAAVNMYQKAVECDQNFDIALANLANALKDQGKTGEAILYYKRAVQINPSFCEPVCGLANALNSICSWAGRGGVCLDSGRLDRWHVDEHGALVDSRVSGKSGSGWIQRVVDIVNSQLLEGEEWGRGILVSDAAIDKFVAQLLKHSVEGAEYGTLTKTLRRVVKSWSGKKNEGARLVRLVERATRLTGWRWYHDKHVSRTEQSPEAYTRPQLPAGLTSLSAPTVLPFHTFTIPMTAKQVRVISQRNGLRMSTPTLRSPWLPKTVFPPPSPPKPYLIVGYVSSDFNNHPLAHLMQSVFGFHDRRRVKAICYATTPSDNSVHRHKIENEAPVFRDVSTWSMERLVQQIVNDHVHILVNLNGYTRGARNEVFAARPAPVQMSFMGFAGTLGAEWCDYILADDTAVPAEMLRPWRRNVDLEDLVEAENRGSESDEWVYGENIIYTRESLFCCDHRQSGSAPGEQQLTWDEEVKRRWKMRKELFPRLSDDAIIFGNFNQLYKIDPTTFRTWLRILSRVPNAVLWLLRFPDLGEPQLRATAQAWAVPEIASRIIFTDVAPKSLHIARACVIDLFLDTPECNAHTTAADCLWSGTPLLTLPRYPWKMASRMAAGILGGALDRSTKEGNDAWKELVVSNEEEYEETAVRLGRGLHYMAGGQGKAEGRLVELRKLVWGNRWRKGGLFDTKRWVRDVEDAYEEAWRRWVAGEGGDMRLTELRRVERSK